MKKAKKVEKPLVKVEEEIVKPLVKAEVKEEVVVVRKRFCYTVVNGIPVATYK